MPIHPTIDPDARLAQVVIQGEVSAEEILAAVRELPAGGWRCCPVLIDARSGQLQLGVEDIRLLVLLVRAIQLRDPSLPAALVVGDEMSYAWGRMYESLDGVVDPGFRTFRDHPRALEWLCRAAGG